MASVRTSFQLVLPVFLVLLTKSVSFEANLPNSGVKNFNASCLEAERKALLKLKQSLKDSSSQLSSWIGDECCKWKGIGCSNETSNVIKLDLSNFCGEAATDPMRACLGGELAPSLLNLTHLSYLDLSNNDFQGVPIPSFIGSLNKLRYLNLSYSSFGGMVPPHLGNLSNLLHLDLTTVSFPNNNPWVTDLNWVSGLSSLQYLGLSGVNLSKATTHWLPAVNMIPSLLELHMSDCQLDDLPQSLPYINFTSLLVFDVSDNNHMNSSLPQWLFNISSLVTMELSGSQFTGSIPEIASLKYLETLRMNQNSLSGPLPTSIGNLSNLQIMDISENSISGPLPTSIGNLLYLQILDLSENSISGPLPTSIGHLSHLQTLDLSKNAIFGSLPTSIGNLSHLQSLDVSFNTMNGTIPESIGQLEQLSELYLWANQWEGVMSETHFQNLTKLTNFKLSSNSLVFSVSDNWIPSFNMSFITIRDCKFASPTFPAWLRTQFVVYIILSNVGISDTIPNWFWRKSPNFGWLDLSSNQLRGKLPDLVDFHAYVNLNNNSLEGTIPLWPGVTYLNLASNRFSGPIPLNIGQVMSEMTTLDVSRNNLNGSIPSSLSQLKSLSSLDLSRNYLSGNIPKDWSSSGLTTIDISNNNLSGQIPSSMCSQMPSLFWLRLSNNNLSGELEPPLQSCARLYILDLGGNNLSGTIPKWIGEKLQSLSYLLLRANRFTGNIPQQLCGLSSLQVLDLSHNNLSGSIPRCLGNLKQLTRFGSMLQPFPSFKDTPDMDPWHVDINRKGREDEYTSLIPLVKTIDLSSNHLSGEIPQEIKNLSALSSFNLSRNQLIGKIPEGIGSLVGLEALDLSDNHLWGPIPLSMISMTFLSKLNVSYNNLSGPIPSTNQFQTFNPTIYEGNSGLCGPPLPTQCSASNHEDPKVKQDEDEDGSGKIWFYVSTALGFILGFWAVFGSLVIKRSWRHAYFQFLDQMKDRLSFW